MNIDTNKAKTDMLTCAALISSKIRSADGQAEAFKEIVGFYLKNGDVDFSADLADTIEDPFVRDSLLIEIASKCAEIDDDEYGLQLAEAVDDFGQQTLARERIISVKAGQKQFEKAFEYAEQLGDQSNAFYAIASFQELPEAMQTIESIHFPLTKIHALISQKQFDKASEIAEEITFDEEKVRAYLEIAVNFIAEKKNDRAIEILSKAQTVCESIQGGHREPNLAQISMLYFRAGSVDLADRTLDLLSDKYQIASCLLSFSVDYFVRDEKADAIESLEEAHTIISSQSDKEVRNSKARFELIAAISSRFAAFGLAEKAIEIADGLRDETSRNSALAQISQICVAQEKQELSKQSLLLIADESEKSAALVGSFDILEKAEKRDSALKYLNLALDQAEAIPQLSVKIDTFQAIARRYFAVGNASKARELATESLENINKILDESQKAISMANLSELFKDLSFELNETELNLLRLAVEKSSR
jgi:tetratricopeptide (TPR) repeat protein